MPTIRSEQMLVFAQASEDQFTKDVLEHLHQFHPEDIAHISSDDLRIQVNEGKARARAYGMTGKSAITGFIALTLKVGPRFDRQQRIHAVLTDPAIEPNDRIQQLRFRVKPLDWAEAMRA